MIMTAVAVVAAATAAMMLRLSGYIAMIMSRYGCFIVMTAAQLRRL
jgi:hypothetical protein